MRDLYMAGDEARWSSKNSVTVYSPAIPSRHLIKTDRHLIKTDRLPAPPKLLAHHLAQRAPPHLRARLARQNTRAHTLALQPLPQPFKPALLALLPHHPPGHAPAVRAGQQLAPVRGADGPAHGRGDGRAGQLRERELQRRQVRGGFAGDGDAARPDGGCVLRGRGGPGLRRRRDTVAVCVGDGGVVVGEQREEDAGRA